MTTMAAVDLGAQSGRVAVGRARRRAPDGHRGASLPEHPGTGRRHALLGSAALVRGDSGSDSHEPGQVGAEVASVGVDSWGVDYAFIDRDGRLVENPVHHRDRRTDGVMEKLFAEVPAREIYERTGIQLMPINTLVQLYAAVAAGRAVARDRRDAAPDPGPLPLLAVAASRPPSTRTRRRPSASTRARRRGRLSSSNDLGCLPESFRSSSARPRLSGPPPGGGRADTPAPRGRGRPCDPRHGLGGRCGAVPAAGSRCTSAPARGRLSAWSSTRRSSPTSRSRRT